MRTMILTLIAFVLTSLPAFAEYSESTFSKYENSVWLAAGFTEGGFSLGADYEYAADRTYGIGGMAKFYKKDSSRPANGIFMFGAYIRPHFHRRAWDLYVSPGVAIINIDNTSANGDDTTSLGPFFQAGVLYQITPSVAIGMENQITAIWFDDDTRGIVKEDIMFRARFSF